MIYCRSLVENGQSNLISSASSSSHWAGSDNVGSSSDPFVSETLVEIPDWLEFNVLFDFCEDLYYLSMPEI